MRAVLKESTPCASNICLFMVLVRFYLKGSFLLQFKKNVCKPLAYSVYRNILGAWCKLGCDILSCLVIVLELDGQGFTSHVTLRKDTSLNFNFLLSKIRE